MSSSMIISQPHQNVSAPFLQTPTPAATSRSNLSYFLSNNVPPKRQSPSFWATYKNHVKMLAVVAAIISIILGGIYFLGGSRENKKSYEDDDDPLLNPFRNFDGGNKSGDNEEDSEEIGNEHGTIGFGQKPENTKSVNTKPENTREINKDIFKNEADYDTYTESCRTKECKEAVAQISASLDYSYLPCDDFYKFACGGWIKERTKKLEAKRNSNVTTITVLGELDELNVKRIAKLIENLPVKQPRNVLGKIKRFYSSCMKQRNLQILVDILKAPENSAKKQFSKQLPDLGDGQITLEEWDFITRELENYTIFADYYNYRRDFDSETKSALCVAFTRELIPEGVAKLFVLSHFNNDPLQGVSVNQLLDNIWNTYRSMVFLDTPWINDISSRVNLSKSISNMVIISGYTGEIFNSTYVEGKYITVTIGDNFLLNLKELVGLRVARKEKGGVFEELFLEFFKDTTLATAFYMRMLDTILIPAGIIQPPVFHHSFPDLLKFAKLGSKAAHEFAHSLSAYMEGIVLESKLRKDPLIFAESVVSPSTKQNYLNRTRCVQDQYNWFEVSSSEASGPFLHVNGTLTKKENVADIIGLQIAFTSFMENAANNFESITGLSEEFSMEQIFFIAHAQNYCQAFLDFESEVKVLKNQVKTDVHSPNAVRVLGSFGNFEEFSKAFSCPIGSKYNPKRKCGFFEN